MIIWRNVDPSILASLLVIASRRYADKEASCQAPAKVPAPPSQTIPVSQDLRHV